MRSIRAAISAHRVRSISHFRRTLGRQDSTSRSTVGAWGGPLEVLLTKQRKIVFRQRADFEWPFSPRSEQEAIIHRLQFGVGSFAA
jgi:hypothetical protein